MRGLLQLIQKQGLSPVLVDDYQRANHAWKMTTARLTNVRKEAGQFDAPQLTTDMRSECGVIEEASPYSLSA